MLMRLILVSAFVAMPALALELSAFNIQILGPSKMGKPHVVDIIVRTMIRYDVTLVQEIRDVSQNVPYELLEKLNEASWFDPYEMVLSERLGRSNSKEQYAYYYRPSQMSVIDIYQYEDNEDAFERPPFIVKFNAFNSAVGVFSYLGIHVKPYDAVAEIDRLTHVYNVASSRLGDNNILLGGDFNAGCNYVCNSCWSRVSLRQDSRFMWLIGDDVDTSLARSKCPYDRLVLAGSRLQGAYRSGSADIFDFRSYFGLSSSVALEVSDHFPVKMTLR